MPFCSMSATICGDSGFKALATSTPSVWHPVSATAAAMAAEAASVRQRGNARFKPELPRQSRPEKGFFPDPSMDDR